MKTITLSLILIGSISSVVASGADVSVVSTSRALRVASVNILEENAPWYVLQQAFSSSLAENLPAFGGKAMPVKMSPMDAGSAAEELQNGGCEAVVVLGEQLPVSFRGSKYVSFKAVSQIGTPVRVFHFVMLKDDPSLVSTLSSAFERATSSASFQDTVGRAATTRIVASNGR